MPPIEQNGFLDNDIQNWITKFRKDHADFFELATDANKLFQKVMLELDAHDQVPQEIIVASLYMRALSAYQGVILMAERGMIPEARVLTRYLLEVIFTLCAIIKNKDLTTVYINEDKKKRLKFLNKFRQFHEGNLPDGIDADEIHQLENELKIEVKKDNIKIRKTEEWAKDAKLHDWYLTAYAVLSDSVHIKISDLERHVVADENNVIKEFKWGPDDTGIQVVLMSSIDGMIVSLIETLTFFKKQREEIIQELRERLHKLVN